MTMLSRNNESRHPCLIADLRGKAFCLLPFKQDINCNFFVVALSTKKKVFISKYFPFLIFPLYHGLFKCIFDFQIFGDFPDIFTLSGFLVNYPVGIK